MNHQYYYTNPTADPSSFTSPEDAELCEVANATGLCGAGDFYGNVSVNSLISTSRSTSAFVRGIRRLPVKS